MNADLERVIALQGLDSATHDAQRRVAGEPERLKAFDARLESARAAVAAAKERLAENLAARRAIEKDVAVHQSRLSKFRDQLMSVKTNVEYQAMQKEIEFAQTEVKSHEDRILERMLEADDLTTAVKRAEAEAAAEQKSVDADRKAYEAELAGVRERLGRMNAERADLVRAIAPQLLALFEMVAKRRNGMGIAEARDGICTICHVRLRPQVFNLVRRNEEIHQCDHCNRILYFVPVPAAAAQTP
jgi:uncharacterized protein